MNPTPRPQDDELLSAYLDGELGDEDRARVDRLLEAQAEYRKVYEELKSLRDSLQALPSYSLGEDFHHRVRVAIERSRPAPSSHQPGSDSAKPPSSGNWHKFVLVIVALAATVLVMALRPWERGGNLGVAMGPDPADQPLGEQESRTTSSAESSPVDSPTSPTPEVENAAPFEGIGEEQFRKRLESMEQDPQPTRDRDASRDATTDVTNLADVPNDELATPSEEQVLRQDAWGASTRKGRLDVVDKQQMVVQVEVTDPAQLDAMFLTPKANNDTNSFRYQFYSHLYDAYRQPSASSVASGPNPLRERLADGKDVATDGIVVRDFTLPARGIAADEGIRQESAADGDTVDATTSHFGVSRRVVAAPMLRNFAPADRGIYIDATPNEVASLLKQLGDDDNLRLSSVSPEDRRSLYFSDKVQQGQVAASNDSTAESPTRAPAAAGIAQSFQDEELDLSPVPDKELPQNQQSNGDRFGGPQLRRRTRNPEPSLPAPTEASDDQRGGRKNLTEQEPRPDNSLLKRKLSETETAKSQRKRAAGLPAKVEAAERSYKKETSEVAARKQAVEISKIRVWFIIRTAEPQIQTQPAPSVATPANDPAE